MYRPLGVDLSRRWTIPWIQPDERVAASATEEARKIKREIARKHLEDLCRHEQALFKLVDREAAEDIYSRLNLEMPTQTPPPVSSDSSQDGDRGDSNNCSPPTTHDADHELVLLARSKFHPDQSAREQAAEGLVLIDKQKIEEWTNTAANCNTVDTEVTATNSDDNPDAAFDWFIDYEQQTQWEDSTLAENKEDDQWDDEPEEYSATDHDLYACIACEPHSDLPTPPPSEMSSVPSSPTLSMNMPSHDTRCPDSDTEEASKAASHPIDELAMVLNDKKALTTYLAGIDEGITKARRTKAEKAADREKFRQRYARPAQRWRGPGQQLAEDKALPWFEFEKMHLYDEASGEWELTVERQGQDYMLARASDVESLDQTTKDMPRKPAVEDLDWNTDTVPSWTSATGSGWFDKES